MEKTSFDTVKVPDTMSLIRFQELINKYNIKRIIRVTPTIPNATDTHKWLEIYYEYYL